MAGLYVTDSPIENSDQREPLPYLEQNLFLNHAVLLEQIYAVVLKRFVLCFLVFYLTIFIN